MKMKSFVLTLAAGGLLLLPGLVAAQPFDCSLQSVGIEPDWWAELCSPGQPTPSGGMIDDPSDPGYSVDLRFQNFVSYTLNNFPGQVVVGAQALPLFAMDFDATATTLYALDNTAQTLGTINLGTGVFSTVGSSVPLAGHTWTGLTISGADNTAYASSTDGLTAALYDIDLGTGTATLINTQATTPLLIDIAINCQGEMYGHDISDDNIYSIDPVTFAATVVGPTGVDSNFAQGMDFDNADGTLYAWTYQGGGANQYGTIDLGTGALTTLASSNPLGEFEGATQTTCPVVAGPSTFPFDPGIPTLGTMGMIALIVLLAGASVFFLRRNA